LPLPDYKEPLAKLVAAIDFPIHPPRILQEAPQIYLGNYGLCFSKVNEAGNRAGLCSLKKVVYATIIKGERRVCAFLHNPVYLQEP
jgi:hypothetical protein